MTVVEIGPGPGRLLVPAARRVLPGGKAIGVEVQQGMLAVSLAASWPADDPGNIQLIHGDASQPLLPRKCGCGLSLHGAGRDSGPGAAHALASTPCPGGRLSITEIVLDPHYQTVAKVRGLAAELGFEFEDITSNWRMYTANFRRPDQLIPLL